MSLAWFDRVLLLAAVVLLAGVLVQGIAFQVQLYRHGRRQQEINQKMDEVVAMRKQTQGQLQELLKKETH